MGTPELGLLEALRLFRKIGLDGVEIICAEDYQCGFSYDPTSAELKEVKRIAQGEGLEVAGLTPYVTEFNSLDKDKRLTARETLSRLINVAGFLDAYVIRIYAGSLTSSETNEHLIADKWGYLIEELHHLAGKASDVGVHLAVENHFNTMAVSAADAARLVKEVDHPNVGILYDQANLAFTHQESIEEALALQRGRIISVHVKDLVFVDRDMPFRAAAVATVDESERAVRSRVVGQGEMDWFSILRGLKEQGYDGWLSLEYERRWHPQDLPPADAGMRESARYIRTLLARLEG